AVIRRRGDGAAVVEEVPTGARTEIACAAVVGCAPRLPGPVIDGAFRVGDCAAPRTALEAVREGEAAARAVLGAGAVRGIGAPIPSGGAAGSGAVRTGGTR